MSLRRFEPGDWYRRRNRAQANFWQLAYRQGMGPHRYWHLGACLRDLTPADEQALARIRVFAHSDGDFCGLALRGWDNVSNWGYDTITELYCCQLYRNTTQFDGQPPDIYIIGFDPDNRGLFLTNAHMLALEIAAATGEDPLTVCQAMMGITAGTGCKR